MSANKKAPVLLLGLLSTFEAAGCAYIPREEPEINPRGVLQCLVYYGLREAEKYDEPGRGGVPRPSEPLLAWDFLSVDTGLRVRLRRDTRGDPKADRSVARRGWRLRLTRPHGGLGVELTLYW